jgi:hypothetical protein
MKKLDPRQVDFIAEIEAAVPRMEKWIIRARELHLWLLERELIEAQKMLRNATSMQLRAFRDDSLVDPEPLYPQGFFPYGRKEP